jgi:hypothetical protein
MVVSVILMSRKSWQTRYLHVTLVAITLICIAQNATSQSEWKRLTPSRRDETMASTQNVPELRPGRALRLIFEYEGDRVRLVSQQDVDVAITGFDLPDVHPPGYYVDSRDAANQTLARVAARDAFGSSAEVFPQQPGDPITRVNVEQPRGAFSVVVPAPEATDHVTVLQVVAPPERAGAPAVAGTAAVVDLVSFPLKPAQ